jgi:hypothetical protein
VTRWPTKFQTLFCLFIGFQAISKLRGGLEEFSLDLSNFQEIDVDTPLQVPVSGTERSDVFSTTRGIERRIDISCSRVKLAKGTLFLT